MVFLALTRELIHKRDDERSKGLSEHLVAYGVASRSLELMFGADWVRKFVTPTRKCFYPFGKRNEIDEELARRTVIDFSAYALSLIYSDSFHQWCQKVRKGKLSPEAAITEAQVAYWLRRNGWAVKLVPEVNNLIHPH